MSKRAERVNLWRFLQIVVFTVTVALPAAMNAGGVRAADDSARISAGEKQAQADWRAPVGLACGGRRRSFASSWPFTATRNRSPPCAAFVGREPGILGEDRLGGDSRSGRG